MSNLVKAAVALREYLESEEVAAVTEFDIPDAVWEPFSKALDAEADREDRAAERKKVLAQVKEMNGR